MKWVFKIGGVVINSGDVVTNFRGEEAVFYCITKSPSAGSTGKVKTSLGEHYPIVYSGKIVSE